ncbi:MAG: DUF3427 domain-containing protein [Mycoplasmatales bacterium]
MIIESIKTSLIDADNRSQTEFRHQLLTNQKQTKFISTIKDQLLNCDFFVMSVAFITQSGVVMILTELKELEKKGIKGQILTGDYLQFTEPKALEMLSEFSNIELKMMPKSKLHAKGFFFKRQDVWTFIVGSSNLTQSAMTINQEWNLKVNSLERGEFTMEALATFNELFEFATPVAELLEDYTNLYELNKQERIKSLAVFEQTKVDEIKPNQMQAEALANLEQLRSTGQTKSLLISATGTGKTYLSAFDVKRVKPKRCLFIIHRETIAKKSLATFKTIINDKTMGLYTGNQKDNADYLFSTVQTLANNLDNFKADEFDYIIIDEVHHAQATTYLKVIEYFKPKFMLGMTATPERSDKLNVFELFDYNICYEIRLHQALENDFLTPFHYFAISELEVETEQIKEYANFNYLVSTERVKHIVNAMRQYQYSGEKRVALMFVSSVKEALELAPLITELGIEAVSLTAVDQELTRIKMIERLESQSDSLELIITVDLFNEGIDIPKVNQVVMLRPTQSSIVYIQQLGRGLRKAPDKEYVIVLDFIGNYENNFMVPVALSQNSTYSKDELNMFVQNPSNLIPGASTVTFEEKTKELILNNIKKTNFNQKKYIEHDYKQLKMELGRIPMLSDFYKFKLMSPLVILKYKKTYYEVLLALKEEVPLITAEALKFLKFLSIHFTPSKRVHELFILKLLISEEQALTIKEINSEIESYLKLNNQLVNTKNALMHLSKEIFKSYSYNKEFDSLVITDGEFFSLSNKFKIVLKEEAMMKYVDDLIEYNLCYQRDNYKQVSEQTIIPFKKYEKKEAFHYLNLDFSNGYQVSGYTCLKEEKKALLFVTIEDKAYDNPIDANNLVFYSKYNRSLKKNDKISNEGLIAQNFFETHLFVKKETGEQFFYLGTASTVNAIEEVNKDNHLVKFTFRFKQEVDEEVLKYLIL